MLLALLLSNCVRRQSPQSATHCGVWQQQLCGRRKAFQNPQTPIPLDTRIHTSLLFDKVNEYLLHRGHANGTGTGKRIKKVSHMRICILKKLI